MRSLRLAAALTVLGALGIAAVACGDGDDGGEATRTPAAAASPTAAPSSPTMAPSSATAAPPSPTAEAGSPTAAAETPAPGASGIAITVTARDFAFEPTALQGAPGTPLTITLRNAGSAPHTLTLYEDDSYSTPVAGADTGTVAGGGTDAFTVTLDQPKEYYFRCEVHNQMQGSLTVS